jgi:hypothetical protein
MPPEFSYRLNGTIVPMLYIFRERVNGKLSGWMRLTAVCDGIGRFTIDDDTHPWEFTFRSMFSNIGMKLNGKPSPRVLARWTNRRAGDESHLTNC